MSSNYPSSLDDASSLYTPADSFSTKPLVTTLAASCTDTDTDIQILAAVGTLGAPTAFGIVSIEDEQIIYTGHSEVGSVYKITGCIRGAFGTLAIGHSSGTSARWRFVSGFIESIQASLIAIQSALGVTGSFNFLSDPGSNGLVKRTAQGITAHGVAGTDYASPTNGSSGQALTSDGSGGFGTPVTLGTMATQAASGVNVTGGTITGMPSPTAGSDVATKSYVDSATAGITAHAACRVGTTANLTATYANGSSGVGATLTNSGTQAAISIDGVSLSVNDRVLVKNQSTPAQNGMYYVSTVGSGASNWVLTRATDYDQASEVTQGSYTVVAEGTTNTGTLWIETGAGPFTIGTTDIVFTNLAVGSQSITITGDATGSGTTGSTTPVTVTKLNGQSLAALSTGLLKNTTSTGVPVIAASGTDYAPATNGTSGQVLTSNGSGGFGTARTIPAGSNLDVQFNDSGVVGVDTGKFVYDKSTHRLGVGGGSPATQITSKDSSGDEAFIGSDKSSGHVGGFKWFTGAVLRFILHSNSTAESSTATGSDLDLDAYDNSGSLIGRVWRIVRSSRIVNFIAGIQINSGQTISSITTSVGSPGVDTALPTEKAVRSSIPTVFPPNGSGSAMPYTDFLYAKNSVGSPEPILGTETTNMVTLRALDNGASAGVQIEQFDGSVLAFLKQGGNIWLSVIGGSVCINYATSHSPTRTLEINGDMATAGSISVESNGNITLDYLSAIKSKNSLGSPLSILLTASSNQTVLRALDNGGSAGVRIEQLDGTLLAFFQQGGLVTVPGTFQIGVANPISGVTTSIGATGLDTKLPTEKSVRTAISPGVNAQTGTSYTIADGDRGKLITHSNASAVAYTLPQAGASSLFISGWYCDIENRGSGTVTITPTTSTIDGASSFVIITGQGIRLFSDGTNYFTQRGMVPATLPPSGAAGGDLSGSYPNPTVVKVNGGLIPTTGNLVTSNGSGQLIDGPTVVTSVGSPGTNNNVPTEAGVRTALNAKVDGPSGATSGNLASFNGTSGKVIQDASIIAANVVQDSGAATAGNIPKYSSSKVITDGFGVDTALSGSGDNSTVATTAAIISYINSVLSSYPTFGDLSSALSSYETISSHNSDFSSLSSDISTLNSDVSSLNSNKADHGTYFDSHGDSVNI